MAKAKNQPTKTRSNVFYYKQMGDIARARGYSASEFFFGCAAVFLKALGCDVSYLTKQDEKLMKSICAERKKS